MSTRTTRHNSDGFSFSSSANRVRLPVEVWREHICQKYLNLIEISMLRCSHRFFEKFWLNMIKYNTIQVPQRCPSLEQAMALAAILSVKKQYTKHDPIKIQLDKGVHKIVGTHRRMNVLCSHITFVGLGKHQTTIIGGLNVFKQCNVKFEGMAIINRYQKNSPNNGAGLQVKGLGTNVEVLHCIVKGCYGNGMWIYDGATVTATQCDFKGNACNGVFCHGINTKVRLNECKIHNNGIDGLRAYHHAVLDLYGTRTEIHCNAEDGIFADHRSKVNIHLPSEHNTSHDNQLNDRVQDDGGSIANINLDGTFTHV